MFLTVCLVAVALLSLAFAFHRYFVFTKLNLERKHLQDALDERTSLLEKVSLEKEHIEKEKVATQVELASVKTALEDKEAAFKDKLELIELTQKKLTDAFKAVSHDALEKNNESFLTLAKKTLENYQEKAIGSLDKKQEGIEKCFTPLKESLKQLNDQMGNLEKERKSDQAGLKEQMRQMVDAEKSLKEETSHLVRSLRSPIVRGQWGELQLRRVVELAGMVKYCDFYEQKSAQTLEGIQRPDMVIKLPGNKNVIVDAKTPFDAFLDACAEQDEQVKSSKLKTHAKNIRSHILLLGKKAYFEQFSPSPEFVILFLPSEAFFSAALEEDPTLMEIGVDQGVILTTPMTLIALLKTVAYGWKQQTLSEHAKEISVLGKELYKRIVDLQKHFLKLGKSITQSVESYNKMVGSIESRVLVTARKFQKVGIGYLDEQMPESETIQEQTRPLIAEEFIEKVAEEQKEAKKK